MDADFLPFAASRPSGDLSYGSVPMRNSEGREEDNVLSTLKELVAAGDLRLDTVLATITESALKMTGASAAALAMWKDGAMVCRARSGELAPALGTQLSSTSGISGECLRTGKAQNCANTENDPFVDIQVCRSLGLLSIAVVPIQGWRGINGILEVFSDQVGAFSEKHVTLLEQLAAIAERARASQPHGASSFAPKPASEINRPQPAGLLPASDRVGDVALAFVDNRSRPFVMAFIGLLAVSLLCATIWLGWRGPMERGGKVNSTWPASRRDSASTANSFTAHPPDNDPIWGPNPGGESLFVSNGKPSAGAPVQFASKVDVVSGKVSNRSPATRASVERSLMPAKAADKVAGKNDSDSVGHDGPSPPAHQLQSAEVNPTLSSPANGSALGQSKAAQPTPAPLVSQGVSGGQLIRRVDPVYPEQARQLRLEGTVVLAAMIMEDGPVRDIRVVDGPPVLAQSAVEAVTRWRYKPFELDGKPVKNQIDISVDFKLPADNR